MFYKVLLNGMVVDIQTELHYVYWQEANHLMISCYEEENANGILSSDGSVIWHVEGLPEFPEGLYQTVIVEKIEEDEYLRWKERLEANTTDADEVVEEQTTANEESANNDVLESKTSIQTLLTIKELEDKISRLEKENVILSERILELSEKFNT